MSITVYSYIGPRVSILDNFRADVTHMFSYAQNSMESDARPTRRRSDVSIADISADSDRSVVSLMARRIRRLQFAQNSTESDDIDGRGGEGEGLLGCRNAAGDASGEERRDDSGAERYVVMV